MTYSCIYCLYISLITFKIVIQLKIYQNSCLLPVNNVIENFPKRRDILLKNGYFTIKPKFPPTQSSGKNFEALQGLMRNLR